MGTLNDRGNKSLSCEGGCHCGAVRFRLALPEVLKVIICNCSICRMTGYQHLTVAHTDFELLRGESDLQEYRFNTGRARHLFCRHCGIKSFYQPRSHPEAWSVNLACVALPRQITVERVAFDGANYEAHIDGLTPAGALSGEHYSLSVMMSGPLPTVFS